jgi:hypothetical protein
MASDSGGRILVLDDTPENKAREAVLVEHGYPTMTSGTSPSR